MTRRYLILSSQHPTNTAYIDTSEHCLTNVISDRWFVEVIDVQDILDPSYLESSRLLVIHTSRVELVSILIASSEEGKRAQRKLDQSLIQNLHGYQKCRLRRYQYTHNR